jgi:hypothetical protein
VDPRDSSSRSSSCPRATRFGSGRNLAWRQWYRPARKIVHGFFALQGVYLFLADIP